MTTRLRARFASSAATAGTVPATPRHHHLTARSSHLPVPLAARVARRFVGRHLRRPRGCSIVAVGAIGGGHRRRDRHRGRFRRVLRGEPRSRRAATDETRRRAERTRVVRRRLRSRHRRGGGDATGGGGGGDCHRGWGGDGAANKAEDSADAFRLKTADASQVSVSPRSFSPRSRRASIARGITSLPPHFSLESAGQIASPDFTSEPLAKSSACSCAGMGFVWVAHSRSSMRFRNSRSGAAYQLVAPEHNGRPS